MPNNEYCVISGQLDWDFGPFVIRSFVDLVFACMLLEWNFLKLDVDFYFFSNLIQDMRSSEAIPSGAVEQLHFVPSIRSGSFADIGPRRYMEDEHIRIDDLSTHLGSMLRCPTPSAFYGVIN